MEQILLMVGVAAAFFIRIGLPVILLIGLGVLIDHWQGKREKLLEQEHRKAV